MQEGEGLIPETSMLLECNVATDAEGERDDYRWTQERQEYLLL
jgi:hypothetical protein